MPPMRYARVPPSVQPHEGPKLTAMRMPAMPPPSRIAPTRSIRERRRTFDSGVVSWINPPSTARQMTKNQKMERKP